MNLSAMVFKRSGSLMQACLFVLSFSERRFKMSLGKVLGSIPCPVNAP